MGATMADVQGRLDGRDPAAGEGPVQPLAIEAVGLTHVFGVRRVVDNLTLSVPTGQIYGLLGPNGAGKTTTLRLLLGLLQPTAGTARMLGHDPCVRRDVVRRHAGAVLTGARLYERVSVRDNLEIYARLHGIPRRERDGRVTAALATTRLQDRPRLRAGALSAGEKQRLLLACAQLHRPAILLLDEPTATLDPTASAELRNHLSSLARDDGVTVLLVTHHVAFAEALCDRVGIMLDGSLLAEGSPQALRERDGVLRQVEVSGWGLDERALALVRRQPWVAEARLSPDGRRLSLARRDDGDNAPLIDLLREVGVVIDEVRRRRPSLEDALVQLARTREGDDGR